MTMSKAKKNAYNRKLGAAKRKKALAEGLCTSCLYRAARDGLRTCVRCGRKASKWQRVNRKLHKYQGRNIREKRKAAGKCYRCGKRAPKAPHLSCGACLARMRTYAIRHARKTGNYSFPRRLWRAMVKAWRTA